MSVVIFVLGVFFFFQYVFGSLYLGLIFIMYCLFVFFFLSWWVLLTWYGLLFLLLYMGGLLVLFFYMMSLKSNPYFGEKLKNKFNMYVKVVFFFFFLLLLFFIILTKSYDSLNVLDTSLKLFYYKECSYMFMMGVYLILILLIMNILTSSLSGSLRFIRFN